MLGSRIWLSVTALVSAAMIVWLLVSTSLLSPIGYGNAGVIELVAYGFGSVIAAFFWLHIYFRPRGYSAIFGSRFALSLCAFLLGAVAAMVLLHVRVITPLSLAKLPTEQFVLFIVCTALPVVIWLTTFFITRRQQKLRGW